MTVRDGDVHNCDPVRQGEEDVHDRHPVYQGHVSANLFTPSADACESLASLLCLLTALTHGCFA